MVDHLIKYLKFSNIKIIFSLNPVHWTFFPSLKKQQDVWGEFDYSFSFLFLTITLFIDDGSW